MKRAASAIATIVLSLTALGAPVTAHASQPVCIPVACGIPTVVSGCDSWGNATANTTKYPDGHIDIHWSWVESDAQCYTTVPNIWAFSELRGPNGFDYVGPTTHCDSCDQWSNVTSTSCTSCGGTWTFRTEMYINYGDFPVGEAEAKATAQANPSHCFAGTHPENPWFTVCTQSVTTTIS